MLNVWETKLIGCNAVADLFGLEYFRNHYKDACTSYPAEGFEGEVDYEYFIGFEANEEKEIWTVFARTSINRETRVVTFLDYKTPWGERMKNPIKPVRWA